MMHSANRERKVKTGATFHKKRERFCSVHGWIDVLSIGEDPAWNKLHGFCHPAKEANQEINAEVIKPEPVIIEPVKLELRKPVADPQNFDRISLTKTLDIAFLNSLSLDALQSLRSILIRRAVTILKEINYLKATDPKTKEQMRAGNFRHEKEIDGKTVFLWSPEPRMEYLNVFVCGDWFEEYLIELESLRALEAENKETFVDRNKAKLISQLAGV